MQQQNVENSNSPVVLAEKPDTETKGAVEEDRSQRQDSGTAKDEASKKTGG